ncbi:MAG: hypothetical protein H6832_15470 [Planctomycetes bacterium]|nr:hypothetical protein [Planctomycetota bacterium]
MAFFRPLASERWTALGPRSRLMPGDSVRTSPRGANAVELGLESGGSLVAGPGTQLRFADDSTIEIIRGDVEFTAGKSAEKAERTLRVRGPGDFERRLDDGKIVLRVADGKTQVLERAPRWLEGYRASATSEWLGSLIANVDGRDVSLTLGSIKITVEIRDQIARTTIEEAFRNNTDSTLEGVFRFPLPSDASISGFGMWIGDELVEADIVEKQRARAIYEQILRERRDPGLLEWSGGNLFKARVFPIFPHSKKRIRIRYTQVLPLEGRTLRYGYPLRSELLAKVPLDELVIDAKVWSGAKISKIESPTHAVQASTDGETASARYEAQNVSPEGDFELRTELSEVPPLRIVSHQRGDDGYFMALVNPPGGDGAWQRTTTPEGSPTDVIVVADVSGSSDLASRTAQHRFVESLLQLLGPQDRFRLLTADSEVHAFAEDIRTPSQDNISEAIAWLESRVSLGWTDLDATFARVHEIVNNEAPNHESDRPVIVVYVGDGVHTAGDGNAAALAARLQSKYASSKASYHAVAPASTYEKSVLETIGMLGNGSWRELDANNVGDNAVALLRDAKSPALEDLEIRFDGLRTARVYPAVLPRIPQGMQQVVLGRYLPTSGNTRGRVIVTGKKDGQPARFEREVVLAGRGEGNSFVPRLWARKHIESLVAEDSTNARDAVIALSAEFGIMTPFTSFLVLENDDDRARFGVERTVHMRDGEDYFAAARDRATETLLREQLEKARGWRIDLQRNMYRELAGLGRDMHVAIAEAVIRDTALLGERLAETRALDSLGAPTGSVEQYFERSGIEGKKGLAKGDDWYADSEADEAPNEDLQREAFEPSLDPVDKFVSRDDDAAFDLPNVGGGGRLRRAKRQAFGPSTPGPGSFGFLAPKLVPSSMSRYEVASQVVAPPRAAGLSDIGFPYAPSIPQTQKPDALTVRDERLRAELVALDRRDALLTADRGARFAVLDETIHSVRQVTTWSNSTDAIWAGTEWFLESGGGFTEPVQNWLSNDQRGQLRLGGRLGRRRASVELDRRAFALPLIDMSFEDLERDWALANIERRGIATDLARIVYEVTPRQSATVREDQRFRMRVTIDITKSRIEEIAHFRGSRKTQSIRFSDFVTALGSDWATRTEVFDDENRLVRRISLQVEEIAREAALEAARRERSVDADSIYASRLDPELDTAKEALAKGQATVIDELMLAAHRLSKQQWQPMLERIEAARSKTKATFAIDLIQAHAMQQARTGQDFSKTIDALATSASAHDGKTRVWFTNEIWNLAASRFSLEERERLLDSLRSVIARPTPNAAAGRLHWGMIEASILQQLGRDIACESLLRQLRSDQPFALSVVPAHLASLVRLGKFGEAKRGWLDVVRLDGWDDGEREQLYAGSSDYLWSTREYTALAEVLATWTERLPESQNAWQRWLSMRLFEDDLETADGWATTQMTELDDQLEDDDRARIQVAIDHAYSNGWQYSANRLTPEWSKRLLDLALRLLDRDETNLVNKITSQWRWRQNTDVVASLRKRMLADLLDSNRVRTMPIDALELRMQHAPSAKGELDPTSFTKIHDALRARWKTDVAGGIAEYDDRVRVARLVLGLLDGRGEARMAYDFARERLAAASHELGNRVACAADAFARLIKLDELALVQRDSIELLDELIAETASDEQRLAVLGNAIRDLSGRLFDLLYKNGLGDDESLGKLARSALRALQTSARESAREGLANWLRSSITKGLAAAWASLEAAGYEAQHGSTTKGIADILEESARVGRDVYRIGSEVRAASAVNSEYESDARGSRLLRERAAILVAYAGVKKGASDELARNTLSWLEEALPQTADDPRDVDALTNETTIDGRYHVARFLLASNRIDQLDQRLQTWIAPDEVASRWRILAGYLASERSDLASAIAQFERVLARDELESTELERLADWKLVTGDREARPDVLLAMAMAKPVEDLRSDVWAEYNRQSRRGSGPAPEFDPDVLFRIRALLTKSSHPANEVWSVRRLYQTCKDHRILEALSCGVVGHTQQGVYGFLGQMSSLLGEVHEEATCDRIDEEIARRLEAEKAPLDARGLRLFRVLVRGRAAAVRNQPGPHEKVALAALRASFDIDSFADGEDLQRATFLQSATLTGASVLEERLRQLETLFSRAPEGTHRQLMLAVAWFGALSTVDAEKARDMLAAALDSNVAAARGQLPSASRGALAMLLGSWNNAHRFAKAEQLTMRLLSDADTEDSRSYLERRLADTRIAAVRHGGTVSIGTGRVLHDTLARSLEAELESIELRDFAAVLQDRWSLAEAGHAAKIDGVAESFIAFANTKLPPLVRRTPDLANYQQIGQTIANISGSREALAFAIARHEDQPRFWRRLGRDVWTRTGYRIAQWNHTSQPLGALEEPLLRLVTFELEDDLTNLSGGSTWIWWKGRTYFWSAHRRDFERVASKVLEFHGDSPARVAHVTNYLWNGLDSHDVAIEGLLAAESRGIIRENELRTLAQWCIDPLGNRPRETLRIVDKLLAEDPLRLDDRLLRIRALYKVDRKDDARAETLATEKLFRDAERLDESSLAALAEAAGAGGAHDLSARFWREAIAVRETSRGGASGPDDQLSYYHRNLAEQCIELREWKDAFLACRSAIVAAGKNQVRDREANSALDRLLRFGKASAIIAMHDAEVEHTGQDAPVLRKAFGRFLLTQRDFEAAAKQLNLAIEMQSNDVESWNLLITAYDQANEPARALEAFGKSLDVVPFDVNRAADYATRVERARDFELAQRAWTNLVERRPDEADPHTKLATRFERQLEWDRAIQQWKRVIEIRTDEPMGWFGLADAKLRAGRPDDARETLQAMMEKPWDARFGDVKADVLRRLTQIKG